MNSQSIRFGVMRFIEAVFAAVVCFAGVVACAHAGTKPDGEVYAGAIGKSAVVVHLYRNDKGQPVGTYFYRSQGVDIGLAVQGKRGQYVECSFQSADDDPAPCDQPTGYWSVAVNGNTVTGSWRKTSSQADIALPVVLKRISAACDLGDAQDERPLAYDCLRAEGLKRVMGKPKISQDGALVWQFIKDGRSDAFMPQLIRAPNPAAMAAINRDLTKKFWDDINIALEAKPGGYDSCWYTVALANRRWFVVESGCDWYWPGSVHPSSGWGSTTYDVATGKRIDWPALIRFPTRNNRTLNFRNGHDIVSLALRHIPEKPGDNDDDGKDHCMTVVFDNFDCKGNVCTNWEYFDKTGARGTEVTLSPHEKGLFVSFNQYAEIDRNCRGEGLTIPWREVRSLLLTPRTFP